VKNTARITIVPLLAVLLGAACLLSACGGGGEDPNQVLNQTFSGHKKVTSGKLGLSLTFSAAGVPQLKAPVTIKLTGPFQSRGAGTLPKFDFDLALAAAGRSFTAGAVSTSTQGFLKFQGASYAVPPNVFAAFKQGFERAQHQQAGRRKPSLSALGIDPRRWLKDAKNEGDANVAGTPTVHISAGIDVAKLLTDLSQVLQKAGQLGLSRAPAVPGGLTAQQRQTIQSAIKQASFDLYTGKADKIVRRIVVKLSFSLPRGASTGASALTGGVLTFDLALANLNQPQTIAAPAGPRPFGQLTAQLRTVLGGLASGLTGAATAGAGAATGAAPNGAAASGPNAQAYLQCLQRASGNVAAAQKCAALLSGR
jgi:hypothetical protein